MPELPDLEVFKVNIFNRLTSKHLIGCAVYNLNKVNMPQAVMQSELIGRDLEGVDRGGKELLFRFSGGKVVSAHLMLNGEVSVVTGEAAVAAIRFKIFSMGFENETVVFSDRGGLCTIRLNPVPSRTPDAFGADFTLDYWLRTARGKSRDNIKAFLIDQKIVRGIGNAYADEILWAARVSPRSTVGRIPEEKMAELYSSIGSVLRGAIDSIKAVKPDIISGEERGFLKVHNKMLKQTATGHAIVVENIASKITYYTDEQTLY